VTRRQLVGACRPQFPELHYSQHIEMIVWSHRHGQVQGLLVGCHLCAADRRKEFLMSKSILAALAFGLLSVNAMAAPPMTHQLAKPNPQMESNGRIRLKYDHAIAHRGDVLHLQLPDGFVPGKFKVNATPGVKVLGISGGIARVRLEPGQRLGFGAALVEFVHSDRFTAPADLSITVRADHEPLDRNFVPKIY
jgi:hypothetical protein